MSEAKLLLPGALRVEQVIRASAILICDHEEADTKLILQAADTTSTGAHLFRYIHLTQTYVLGLCDQNWKDT